MLKTVCLADGFHCNAFLLLLAKLPDAYLIKYEYT